jgi:hypothetical protein
MCRFKDQGSRNTHASRFRAEITVAHHTDSTTVVYAQVAANAVLIYAVEAVERTKDGG